MGILFYDACIDASKVKKALSDLDVALNEVVTEQAPEKGILVGFGEVPNGFNPDLGQSAKPPIGVIPRKFHEENRISELMSAIERYLSDGKMIAEEWVDELNELLYNRIDRKVEA